MAIDTTLPDVSFPPCSGSIAADAPLQRLVSSLRSWGVASSKSTADVGHSASTQYRQRSGLLGLRKSRGTHASNDEGAIGQSPVHRTVKRIPYSNSQRSSGTFSSVGSLSGNGRLRSEDASTNSSSLHSPLASPTGSLRQGDIRYPNITSHAPALNVTPVADRSLPSLGLNSFATTLGLHPAPIAPRWMPGTRSAPTSPVLSRAGSGAATPVVSTSAPATAPGSPTPFAVRPDAVRDAINRPALERGRSTSTTELRISMLQPQDVNAIPTSQPLRSALRSPTPNSIASQKPSAVKGPVVFHSTSGNAATWTQRPRPRLTGHYKAEQSGRSDPSLREGVTAQQEAARTEAVRDARHRALLTPSRYDPRVKSKPIGSTNTWTAQAGLAEAAPSRRRGNSPLWAANSWRTPRKPATRSMATQTPDGEMVTTRPRSNSASSLRPTLDSGFTPKPRKRASSLCHYRSKLKKETALTKEPSKRSSSLDHYYESLQDDGASQPPSISSQATAVTDVSFQALDGEEMKPAAMSRRIPVPHVETDEADEALPRASMETLRSPTHHMHTSLKSPSLMALPSPVVHDDASGSTQRLGSTTETRGVTTDDSEDDVISIAHPSYASSDALPQSIDVEKPLVLTPFVAKAYEEDVAGGESTSMMDMGSERNSFRYSMADESDMVTAPSTPAAVTNMPLTGEDDGSWLDLKGSPGHSPRATQQVSFHQQIVNADGGAAQQRPDDSRLSVALSNYRDSVSNQSHLDLEGFPVPPSASGQTGEAVEGDEKAAAIRSALRSIDAALKNKWVAEWLDSDEFRRDTAISSSATD